MSQQRKQILQMLADGKINADEAERLLTAIESDDEQSSDSGEVSSVKTKKPRFLHIKITAERGGHHGHENVNVKVPIMLMKAGLKLGSLLPKKAHEKFSAHLSDHGIDLDLSRLGSEEIDVLVQALTQSSIDIETDNEQIRIFCA